MAARYGILTTAYPHRGDPVAGCFVREMARALAARGHAVRVACLARRGDGRWDDPAEDPGVEVVAARYAFGETFYGAGAPDALGLGGSRARWRALAGAPHAMAALGLAARSLAGCRALVSHFALPSGALAAVVRRGRPHVAVVHGTDGWLLARMPRAAQALVLGGATAVWYTHAALRERLAHPPGVPCFVRPMGWSSVGELPRVSAPELRLVALARLVPVKRVHLAVDAVAALAARGVDATLTVGGDGPEAATLAARAARVAPGRVRFPGAVAPDDRGALFSEADVFVHTAGPVAGGRTEGAPLAVVEAMGAGLPVVAFDAGGVRDIVGDAGVVLPGDATAGDLADALAALPSGAARELGARARGRVEPWRWGPTAAWLESLLER